MRKSTTLSAIGTQVPIHERELERTPGPFRINKDGDSSRTRRKLLINANRVVKMDVK